MTVLEARRLHLQAGGHTVLSEVSARFEPGQVTAILGANGAGKSTLLAALAGLSRPADGEVLLDEAPLLDLPPRRRAQRLGFIPQSPEIAWGLEVRTVVGLGRLPWLAARGLSGEDEAAIDRALAAARVEDLAARDITTLSGGERARALIARALAGEPEWLLADEPYAGLDPRHALEAGDLFRRLAGDGAGVLLTLHDLTLAARLADRVLVLGHGRVLADGPPAAAMTPEILAAAYGIDARLRTTEQGLSVDILGRWG
ncbi:MAG: ABC transporter ATP-binding protein [Phenylobacterium sp.]|jgi:iron complex transport system ATP-binding protein|nr:ABC transporter ATP-binding protein [Phenylobacterium sp.]